MDQYHDDDYDPFGLSMLDDDTQQTIDQTVSEPVRHDVPTTDNTTHDFINNEDNNRFYPGYAWTNNDEDVDEKVIAKMRPLEEGLSKHKHDRFQVPLTHRPQNDKKQRGINYHSEGRSPHRLRHVGTSDALAAQHFLDSIII